MKASWPQTKTIWSICIKVRDGQYGGPACNPEFWKEQAENGLLTRENASSIISAFIDKDEKTFVAHVRAHDAGFPYDPAKFAAARRWKPKPYKAAGKEIQEATPPPLHPELQVGDRVTASDVHPHPYPWLTGEMGTIRCGPIGAANQFGVEWDRPIKDMHPSQVGHDCDGRAKEGHGWYVDGLYIMKIAEPVDDIAIQEQEQQEQEDAPAEGKVDEFEMKLRELEKLHRKQKEEAARKAAERELEPFDIKSIGYIKPAIFDDVCTMVKGGVQVCLVGPSGCGKSLLIREIAKVLGMNMYMESFAGGKRYAQIFGSIHINDGKSEWLPARFLQELTKENNIVFMDEVMSADSDVLIGCNSILDRGTREFHSPIGTYNVNPTCIIAAASNVTGREYSQNYKGTQQQDASVLNRFVHVPMDYDMAVEEAILKGAKVDKLTKDYLTKKLANLRQKINLNHISYDPSTRKLVQSIELIRLGMKKEKAFEYSFLTPLSPVERRKIEC